MAKETLKEIP